MLMLIVGLSEPGNRRSLTMLYNHTHDDELAIPSDKTVGTDVELKGRPILQQQLLHHQQQQFTCVYLIYICILSDILSV